jgi:MFS family permease
MCTLVLVYVVSDILLCKSMVQILGGIWADRFGGKVVLGFGVVWWSIATVLTPLAAKIGLPCLLITRAFMGIGEVIMSSACLYTMYCIITLYRLLCMKCEH